jgi:hypothetical protein
VPLSIDGSIKPSVVVEDWPDWFDVTPAFVAVYCPDLSELEGAAVFLTAIGVNDETRLDGADQAYLAALEARLDVDPEMQSSAGPSARFVHGVGQGPACDRCRFGVAGLMLT